MATTLGTGSVTTMVRTGAEHGMLLFWALVISCIFTFILMVVYGRMTLVSGHTALYNIKNEFRYGWILALYILLALVIGEFLALMGLVGIVSDLVQEGIRLFFNDALVDRFWIILFFSILSYVLVWIGRYITFEKVLTIFVMIKDYKSLHEFDFTFQPGLMAKRRLVVRS